MDKTAVRLTKTLYAVLTPSGTPRRRTLFRITTAAGLEEVAQLATARPDEVRFVEQMRFLSLASRGRLFNSRTSYSYTVVSNCELDGLSESWVEGSAFRHVADVSACLLPSHRWRRE